MAELILVSGQSGFYCSLLLTTLTVIYICQEMLSTLELFIVCLRILEGKQMKVDEDERAQKKA